MDPADEFHSPYTYVGGDPVNLVDPDGRASESCPECAGGVYDAVSNEVGGIVDFGVGLFTGETWGDLSDAGEGLWQFGSYAVDDPSGALDMVEGGLSGLYTDFQAAGARGKSRMITTAGLGVFSPGKVTKVRKISGITRSVRAVQAASKIQNVSEAIVHLDRGGSLSSLGRTTRRNPLIRTLQGGVGDAKRLANYLRGGNQTRDINGGWVAPSRTGQGTITFRETSKSGGPAVGVRGVEDGTKKFHFE